MRGLFNFFRNPFRRILERFCSGDVEDRTYFDYSTYRLASLNRNALIEHYDTIKESGLYALIRISAVVKVGRFAEMRIALGDTRIRGNVVNMLKNKAKELGNTNVFAFSIDTRRDCLEATYSKISNWILLKLQVDNQLYNLALKNKNELRKFLSSLLNFARLQRRMNREINKQNLIDAIDRGISGFDTIDPEVLAKIKNTIIASKVLMTIPVLGQIIALVPIILTISNMALAGVEIMRGTFKIEVFDIIPYRMQNEVGISEVYSENSHFPITLVFFGVLGFIIYNMLKRR